MTVADMTRGEKARLALLIEKVADCVEAIGRHLVARGVPPDDIGELWGVASSCRQLCKALTQSILSNARPGRNGDAKEERF